MARSVSIYVDVDVLLCDIDTDDLIEELESRGEQALKPPKNCFVLSQDDMDDLVDAINRVDLSEVRTLLDRVASPKWRNSEACKKSYDEARKQ